MEELQEHMPVPENLPANKPTGLGILFVLSVISSATGMLSNFCLLIITSGAIGLTHEEMLDQMASSMKAFGLPTDETSMEAMRMILDAGPAISVIGLITCLLTLVAVVYMYKGKKLGFHLYVGARILETFMPLAVVGAAFFSTFTMFTSAIFIYFYSRYLKDWN